MVIRFAPRIAVLFAVVVAFGTGCSGPGSGSPATSLQLRPVISSAEGGCSTPTPTAASSASACGWAGHSTYRLAKSLGTITPASVALSKDQGSQRLVTLKLNRADTKTLGDVTRKALGKRLAIVLDGRVISAPHVMDALTDSDLTLAFGSASKEAEQVAARLGAAKSD
jgi:preprotein translocase subunit SecD